MSSDEWVSQMIDDEMTNDCSYLSYVINETLRLDPSARFTSILEILEEVEICGKRIPQGQNIIVNLTYLMNDPRQWIEPSSFIPERFDPTSPYFLTP